MSAASFKAAAAVINVKAVILRRITYVALTHIITRQICFTGRYIEEGRAGNLKVHNRCNNQRSMKCYFA